MTSVGGTLLSASGSTNTDFSSSNASMIRPFNISLAVTDCLYALQPTVPHLTRSSLHRCLQRHGIGRLPDVEGDKPAGKKFKSYPIGYFHIDIAEVQTAEGKLYLYVAIDRTSKFTFVQVVRKTGRTSAAAFLTALIEAVPYKIHTVLTDNGIHFPAAIRRWSDGALRDAHVRHALPRERDRAPAYQSEAPLDEWAGREDEPHDQGSHGPAIPLRQPSAARSPSRRLRQRLQLRTKAQDPEGPHTIRVHLQNLDKRA
jgi:hypothetical protein